MIEVRQNRVQGVKIEAIIKDKKLTQKVIARKIGESERAVNKVIWGESNNSVIRESIALVLGFRSWKEMKKVCS